MKQQHIDVRNSRREASRAVKLKWNNHLANIAKIMWFNPKDAWLAAGAMRQYNATHHHVETPAKFWMGNRNKIFYWQRSNLSPKKSF